MSTQPTYAHLKARLLLAMVLFTGFGLTASAVPVQLTPFGTSVLSTYYINKNGTGPGNGNDSTSQLYRLNTYFIAGPDLVITDSLKPATQTNDWSGGGRGAWDYAVIHFGAGAYGGSGGSVGAWYLNGADSFVFPQGSFSSIDFFRTRAQGVPDSGATIVLMAMGAGLLLLGRRKLAAG